MKNVVKGYLLVVVAWLCLGAITLALGKSALSAILAAIVLIATIGIVPVGLALIGYGLLVGTLKIPMPILGTVALGLVIWLVTWLHSIKPF